MLNRRIACLVLFFPSCLAFTALRHHDTLSTPYVGICMRKRALVTPEQDKRLQMTDKSCSYWFHVGDMVQVSTSVRKAGFDLKGRIGKVTETWEKCSVDPTCCCAEFVDENFAVTVRFEGKLDPNNYSQGGFILGIDENFTHHFNEDELVKVDLASGRQ